MKWFRRILWAFLLLSVIGLIGSIRNWSDDTDQTFLAFSPDGQLLAVGSFWGDVQLWDLSDSKPIHSQLHIREQGTPLGETAKFVGPTKLAAIWEINRQDNPSYEILVWDVKADQPQLRIPLTDYESFEPRYLFSDDGRWLVAATGNGDDPRIDFWDLQVGRVTRTFSLTSHVYDMEISADASTAVFWTEDQTERLQIWDRESQAQVGDCTLTTRKTFALSPDGNYVAHGGRGVMTILDLVANQNTDLPADDSFVYGPLEFSRDGNVLLTSTDELTYDYWNRSTRAHAISPLKGLFIATLSPKGDRVAFWNRRQCAVWNTRTNRITPLPDPSRNVFFNPLLYSCGMVMVLVALIITRVTTKKTFAGGVDHRESDVFTAQLVDDAPG